MYLSVRYCCRCCCCHSLCFLCLAVFLVASSTVAFVMPFHLSLYFPHSLCASQSYLLPSNSCLMYIFFYNFCSSLAICIAVHLHCACYVDQYWLSSGCPSIWLPHFYPPFGKYLFKPVTTAEHINSVICVQGISAIIFVVRAWDKGTRDRTHSQTYTNPAYLFSDMHLIEESMCVCECICNVQYVWVPLY